MTEQTFTQEDVNRIVSERVAREKEKIDELTSKYTELTNQFNEVSTKFEDAKSKIEDLPKLQRQNLVNEVARKLNVPEVLVNRLQGETKEEIEADAQRLVESLGNLKDYKGLPKTPDGKGEPRKTGMQAIVGSAKTVN